MQNAATDPIVGYVEAGRDVRIVGAGASARLDAVAATLDATCNVIRLTAPPGGLRLSALIAQLSGRENFDDHDDGALELAFRRLCGADAPGRRPVLLLDAAHGVQRPVLRYLQQVGRAAPPLLFVIAACPELEAFMAAPDMARLRARLDAVVVADDAAPVPALSLVPIPVLRIPPDWTMDLRRREPPKRRLGLLWPASCLALAASAAFGFWLGQVRTPDASGMVADSTTRMTVAAPKLSPALVAAPPLAAKVDPALAATTPTVTQAPAAPGSPAAVPLPVLAKSATPLPAATAEPPVAILAKAEPVIVASVEEPMSLPTLHARPAEPRRAARPRSVARVRPPMEAPRYAEEEYYGPEDDMAPVPRRNRLRTAEPPMGGAYDPYYQAPLLPYGAPDSRGARYLPPADGDYTGRFLPGPYGARPYRYGP